MSVPRLYRVQHADGRGPFRPGFSRRWLDDDGSGLPALFEDFDMAAISFRNSRHYGCACRTIEGLRWWFSQTEWERLKVFGYAAVRFKPNKIVAESKSQVLFERCIPLNERVTMFDLYGSES